MVPAATATDQYSTEMLIGHPFTKSSQFKTVSYSVVFPDQHSSAHWLSKRTLLSHVSRKEDKIRSPRAKP